MKTIANRLLWLRLRICVRSWFLLPLGIWAAGPAFGGDAAEVVFAAGQVTADGAPAALGGQIQEGQILVTGADGYLYLRAKDQGVFILRPNSRATIERYRFDPADPGRTQVKVVLERGVMRGISGSGVKAARERFRFNTPVAAIGVRGTDFSVFTTGEISRVSVRSGGIVMTGFGAGCAAEGLGPCEGEGAEELFASQKDAALLQLQRGDSRPQRLDTRYQHLAPDTLAPPNTQEPSASSSSAGQQATAVVRSESELLSAPPAQVDTRRRILWGRWSPLAGLPANVDLATLPSDLETVVKYPTYGLWREGPLTGALPREGRGEFILRDHEGYFVADNRVLEAARAENASLSVNFATRQFDTRMDLIGEKFRTDIKASGTVEADGFFASDFASSNTYVRGALAGENGKQAGYLYQRAVAGSVRAVGATFWTR